MTSIATQVAESIPASSLLVYGVMASATTVYVNGSATATTVKKLDIVGTLATNDYVAIIETGGAVTADRLIIGKVAT